MIKRHVELRQAADGDGFSGTILRYGDEAKVYGSREQFIPGSIAYDDVILNLMHDRGQPVARTGTPFLEIRDSSDALTLTAKYPDTVYGTRAREMIEAGVLRGLSAEFIADDERWDGNRRVINRARLYGVGIVDRPAYAMSTIDRELTVPLEYRQRGLSAFIPFGVEFITSLAKRQKRIISRELELADDIFLLDGYDYNRALASSLAGSLIINQTAEGIAFSAGARALRRSPTWTDVRKRLRAGLVNGVVPGMQIIESETFEAPDGYVIEDIKKAGLCEVNLTARIGAAVVGRGGRTRRRWLY